MVGPATPSSLFQLPDDDLGVRVREHVLELRPDVAVVDVDVQPSRFDARREERRRGCCAGRRPLWRSQPSFWRWRANRLERSSSWRQLSRGCPQNESQALGYRACDDVEEVAEVVVGERRHGLLSARRRALNRSKGCRRWPRLGAAALRECAGCRPRLGPGCSSPAGPRRRPESPRAAAAWLP